MPVLQEEQATSKAWTVLPCIAATSPIVKNPEPQETKSEIQMQMLLEVKLKKPSVSVDRTFYVLTYLVFIFYVEMGVK